MDLPIELARTLLAVVDEGTLEAAARTLHLTPSAVSQRIRALEERVGRVVLVRSKPARATEAGVPILRLARQLTVLEHEVLAELGALGPGAMATVPLAVNADSLDTWFMPAVLAAARRTPIAIELHRDDQERTADLLESGAVIAAVTARSEPVAGCVARPLGSMRYLPVAAPQLLERRFAAGGADWASAPVVDFDRRDELQSAYLSDLGVDPAAPPRHRVPTTPGYLAAVLGGLGWGLLPAAQASEPLASGRLVRLPGPERLVPMHWQQWRLRAEALDVVAEEVEAAALAALER